jgi:predicted dehydrogenase
MRVRIAVVGVGNLGARHLQSLARLDADFVVDVVDPSQAARDRGVDLFAEAGGLKRGHVNAVASLERLSGTPDLAIVATNSAERPRVIRALVEAGTPNMILEKVLFTRLEEYDAAASLFAMSGTRAWVNCGRRFAPRTDELLAMVHGKPFNYRVDGAGWGLACNVIHHLDEFAFLTGCDDVVLSGDELDSGAIPSKRRGYIEFTGTLSGRTANGSNFSASCVAGDFSGRRVTIEAEDLELTISQFDQTLRVSNGQGVRTVPFPIPLQSEVTARHVTDILDGKQPSLPDYSTAARLHRLMLDIFISHLRRCTGNSTLDECPVT